MLYCFTSIWPFTHQIFTVYSRNTIMQEKSRRERKFGYCQQRPVIWGSFNCVLFICLFGILRCFQHCTGHITTGSWKGRGNQYIEFARVLYCKLLTNGKQLPAFPLTAMTGDRTPAAEVGCESVTTLPPWPL